MRVVNPKNAEIGEAKGCCPLRFNLRSFALALCLAGVSSSAFAQADTRGLSDRLDQLERSVTNLQAQGYRGGGSGGASSGGGLSNDSYSILDNRLSALEQQLRDITGQIERSNYETRQLSSKLDRVQADNDIRLQELEQKTVSGGSPSHSSASAGNAASPPQPTASAGGALGSTNRQSAPLAANPGKTPQEQYDYAFGLLRNNDYAGASAAFQSFVQKNGDDPLAGNAVYWLAQIPYAQGQWEKAAPLFLDVYRKYPKSAKAGESLLKLGLSMGKLGKKQEACTSINRFIKEYPNASDSLKRSADMEKSRLGC